MRQVVQVMVILGGVAALAASATAPSTHNVQASTTVSSDYEATWEALIDLSTENQWNVTSANKDSGFVSSDWMTANERYADCGGAGLAIVRGTFIRFNVRVKADGATTKVTVNTTFKQERELDNSRFVANCTSTGVAEFEVQQSIYKGARSSSAKAKQREKENTEEKRYFCTQAPADARLAICARSETACAKRQEEIIATAGDATPCAPRSGAVCFGGINADGVAIESCHPSEDACLMQHDKTTLTDATDCK